MADMEKLVDDLIDGATKALQGFGKILEMVESPNAEAPPTPSAAHAFDSDNSRLVASLKAQVSDLEAQQRDDVSRLARQSSQIELAQRDNAKLRRMLDEAQKFAPEQRREPGLVGDVYRLIRVAANIDGTDVVIVAPGRKERRVPVQQWASWEKVK